MPIRTFSRAHLIALDLPPDSQRDVEDRGDVHLDEHVRTLKYTQIRRLVFTSSDGFTYAVEYEAPLDTGDFEVSGGPVENHGWDEIVAAVEVELRLVAVDRWMPVADDGPDPDHGADSVLYQLTETYMETGCREDTARAGAAELLADHARELAAFLADRHPQAAYDLRGHARDLTEGTGHADDTDVAVDQDEETDSNSDVLALIAEIAGRLKDATDGDEYHAVGLICELANGRAAVVDCQIDLSHLTFRHA